MRDFIAEEISKEVPVWLTRLDGENFLRKYRSGGCSTEYALCAITFQIEQAALRSRNFMRDHPDYKETED